MSTGVKRSITDFFTVSKRQRSTTSKKAKAAAETAAKKTSPTKSSHNPTGLAMFNLKTSTLSTKFDKEAWVSKLTPEQKKLLDLEINTMDDTWLAVLHKELTKPYFLELKQFLESEWSSGKTIFPPQKDIYSWSRLAPLNKVKVLILGQDPYHNFNQAHGLAFSVHDPKTRVPPSLVNIYKCLKKDYPDFEIPKSGDLTKWAEEGILLLNTCLTVRAHNANSHSGHGWEKFTSAVIRTLIDHKSQGLVVIAWGSPAQRTIRNVGSVNWDTNLFLKSVHPSPLSASRGFFDCQHFVKCNNWLYERYGADGLVNWALVEGNKLEDLEKKREKSQQLHAAMEARKKDAEGHSDVEKKSETDETADN